MENIYKIGLKESIRIECENNESAYPIEECGNSILPTDYSCAMIAQWISNEWDNFCPVYDNTKKTLEEAKGDFNEYMEVCISTFYEYLEFSDGEYQEIGDSKEFLFNEVKRLLKENYDLQ